MDGAIKTERRLVRLTDLIAPHRDEVARIAEEDRPESTWALDPACCTDLPIVRRVGCSLAVVDGFHRLAGMVVFGSAAFPVIVVEAANELLGAIDGDSEIGSCEALDAIYASDAAR